MIKLKKLVESIDWEYMDNLNSAMIKFFTSKKKVKGWEFGYDKMSGTFEWTKPGYVVLATPFWDGNNGIPVNVMKDDGDEIADLGYVSKFKPSGDVKKDVTKAYNELSKILLMLDKNLARLSK